MTVNVVDVEPEERKRGSVWWLQNSSQCQRSSLILIVATLMFFFTLGCGYISLRIAHHVISMFRDAVNLPSKLAPNNKQMEDNYATITHVELGPNILVPLEWPIQGIKSTVLSLAKKMILEPDDKKCFLEIQNIPAKLVRYSTQTGSINIFQTVSHEELADAIRCDGAFPTDDHSIKIDVSSGSQSCCKMSVAIAKKGSSQATTSTVGLMPPGFKLASERVIVFLLIVVIVFGSILILMSLYWSTEF